MSGYSRGYAGYVNGNTARQIAVPERRQHDYEEPQRSTKKLPRRRKKVSIISILVTIGAIVASLYLCVSYVMVFSDITATSKKIASLEAKITETTASNEADYEEINSSVDLKTVYDRATKQLGMVPAKRNQVYTYDDQKSDRVIQYSDIPE